jgi:hypothetical protein
MQDIYKYKPETNHVCIVHIVAGFLRSQYPLPVMLILNYSVLIFVEKIYKMQHLDGSGAWPSYI